MIVSLTDKLKARQNLSRAEMTQAMRDIMTGNVATQDIADFILALSNKGETVEEIVAAVCVMRALAVPVRTMQNTVLDTCGTGADSKGTFNISTTAAFVISACGVTVAKHGNRAVSSSCGSADVLEAAGIKLSMAVEKIEQCLNDIGIAFLYAPDFHPAMKYAAAARKQLGRRTIFNIMGPLCNPACATHQLVGVFSADMMAVITGVLGSLGTKRALVIHSIDGLDEISTTGTTLMSEYRNGVITDFEITPEMFGFHRVSVDQLQSKTVEDSVATMLDILKGSGGFKRDIVVLNAAGGLYVADKVGTIAEGVAAARYALDSGDALKKFEDLKEFTIHG